MKGVLADLQDLVVEIQAVNDRHVLLEQGANQTGKTGPIFKSMPERHIPKKPVIRRETEPELDPLDVLYDKALEDEATLREWDEEQAHEIGTDPERARKLAAMRTEMHNRSLRDGRSGK